MKKKLFHIASSFKSATSEDGSLKIVGMASTSDTDRVGDVVLPKAWSNGGIDNYKKNPIILFNHDYNKPIGRASSISVSDNGLGIEAKISSADPELQKLIEDGVLSAFSVGFAIKEADYIEETDGFLIKDAELFEVSVVSVPCNQDATFSVAKSFDNEQEYNEYKQQFVDPAEPPAENSAKAQDSAGDTANDLNDKSNKEIEMDPVELQKMLKEAAEAAAKETANAIAANAAEAARVEAEEKAAQEAFDVKVKTSAERLLEDIEKRFADKTTSMEATVVELQSELKAKADEIEAIQKSKRHFTDRNDGASTKELEQAADEAFVLGLATGKGWDTEIGKRFAEKTAGNPGGGVEVPNLESWETLVSTNIERDIQHALVLAPMFREIQMNSAVMKFPVLPDAGYAEFTAQNTNASGSAFKGNLDERGATYGSAYDGVDIDERTLTVKTIKSVSYLGNEVEEDAILPILPLIRESIVRSHARTVESAILLGASADAGAQLSGSFTGLAKFAADNSTAKTMGTDTAGDASFGVAELDAADLLVIRKAMGKYGMRPSDVVYIINERGYYELIQDTEWQDVNQVGADSMKLKGAVGRIYGSEVIVCDEFVTPATGKVCALAVNKMNFLMPRLRGMRLESDYEVVNQRQAMIATQRLGFDEVISGATAVASLLYP